MMDLRPIKDREKLATEGPWVQRYGLEIMGPRRMRIVKIRGWGHLTGQGVGGLGMGEEEAKAVQVANAEFIAHARDDVPALVTEVDRLNDLLMRVYRECVPDCASPDEGPCSCTACELKAELKG